MVLVVNTATACGFTPQYEELEKLHEKYNEQGLEILDIPCNQFGGQAPGSDEEIHEFCSLHFNTRFAHMHKSDVNGENELPLYTFLKSEKGFEGFTGEKADFYECARLVTSFLTLEKLLILSGTSRSSLLTVKGNVVARFEPTADMADVEKAIQELL